MKSLKAIVCVFFGTILAVSGCYQRQENSSPPLSIQQESEMPHETTGENEYPLTIGEYNHQIFYGGWEITSFIPGGRFAEEEEAEKYIGTTIAFSFEEVTVDKTVVLENPLYKCVLINTEDRHYFRQYYSPDNPSDVIHTDSPYFAYVYIDNGLDIKENLNNNLLRYMEGFYIRDVDTLVFDGSFGLLKLQRISHPPNYQDYIGGV